MDSRKNIALPIGAAAAANATMNVMSHFVFRVYSGGRVTSGIRAKRPNNPLLLDRGIIVAAFDRTEDDRDLDRACTSVSPTGLGDLVDEGDTERSSLSFSALPNAPPSSLRPTTEKVPRDCFSMS
jgi:hypothetical protein